MHTSNNKTTKMPSYIRENFIGKGSFGEVYEGRQLNDPENKRLALKFETKTTVTSHSQLRHEYKVYKELRKRGNVQGFPRQIYFGQTSAGNLLILDLLGPSLNTLLDQSDKGKFSLKTVLQIADQTIKRLESLHNNNLIHRDIKPDNFCIGLNDNEIYCLDLGLSRLYIDKNTNKHLPYCEKKRLVGTPRYASIYAHNGQRYGRRDDLMSLAYTLIFLLKGSLPWQGLQIANKEDKYKQIAHLKNTITNEELSKDIPIEFSIFLQYTKDLEFDEKPDYYFLRQMFNEVYIREGYIDGIKYYWDWDKKSTKRKVQCLDD